MGVKVHFCISRVTKVCQRMIRIINEIIYKRIMLSFWGGVDIKK